MNNKQIESKTTKATFDISKYAKISNGRGRGSSVDGIYKSSFGISNMKDFLKNATYNGDKLNVNDDIIKKLLTNMQNVKNWHLINNYVKCVNQKTIALNDGGEVLQNKIWYCKIDDGTKTPYFTKYTKKINEAHFSAMAKQLLDEWESSQNDKAQIAKYDDIMKNDNHIGELLKISTNVIKK